MENVRRMQSSACAKPGEGMGLSPRTVPRKRGKVVHKLPSSLPLFCTSTWQSSNALALRHLYEVLARAEAQLATGDHVTASDPRSLSEDELEAAAAAASDPEEAPPPLPATGHAAMASTLSGAAPPRRDAAANQRDGAPPAGEVTGRLGQRRARPPPARLGPPVGSTLGHHLDARGRLAPADAAATLGGAGSANATLGAVGAMLSPRGNPVRVLVSGEVRAPCRRCHAPLASLPSTPSPSPQPPVSLCTQPAAARFAVFRERNYTALVLVLGWVVSLFLQDERTAPIAYPIRTPPLQHLQGFHGMQDHRCDCDVATAHAASFEQ